MPRTVGDSPPPSDAATRLEEATRALGGAEPMGLDEARRVLGRVHGTKDAAELAADRAEAIAQMDLAKATLAGLDTPPSPPGPPPRS
ncbi:MAG: hypothetical protein ACRDY7_05200, partial [Acidimicrobiia bacterium]